MLQNVEKAYHCPISSSGANICYFRHMYRIYYPEEFCLTYLCQQLYYAFQLGALAVLGVSIWILVDQPSFLKVLNLTDDVVGGFQVSFFFYVIKNIFFKLHLVRTCKSTKAQPLYFWLSLFWSSL